jgi:hypothetical protein
MAVQKKDVVESEMTDAQALAFTAKEIYEALKAEGFNSNWAGDFVKQFFQGAAK